VALAGPDHSEPESLVRDADYAMYQAKQAGGARFEVFDRKLEFHLTEIQERERELRHMLDQRQFELWYEPVYALADGKLAGFESVLRCDRDSAIFRDLFALAEDTGLSIGIGRDTIETVCRQLKAWQTMGRDLTLSVKLTQRQFYHQDLVAQLAKILAVTGADPTQLMIEVSESTLNGDPDAAVVILQRIVDLNVHVAVDEFGASLAPVNYLVRLPLDVVKMDPKLTASVTAGGRSVAVLETLIHLGRLLGVQVVAQGIETAEQLDALRQMGCELGQGPLMSAAVDLSRAERLAGLAYWTITS
jgi:EAL domain-containing protein (putative c-di-GMP-specific phosphodiesterase class I)